MKQITTEDIFKLLNQDVLELKATQNKICLPILSRLFHKMNSGIKFTNIKVVEGLIIEGHHRYLASQLANYDLGRDLTLKPSKTIAIDGDTIEYTNDEWDTPARIKMLNEEDEKYNLP